MSTTPAAPPLAVALSYEGDRAPRVVAKGAGETAERILAMARECGVTLHEDPDLVQLLARLELGQEIPRALYVAVAQVLAFAWALAGRAPPKVTANHVGAPPLEGRVDQ